MGKFVRNISFSTEFDGDTWHFTLRPLTHGDAVRFLSALSEQDQAEAYKLASELLPSYLVSVSGGTDAAGTPITAEELCTLAYFGPLVARVIEKWLEQSMPGN